MRKSLGTLLAASALAITAACGGAGSSDADARPASQARTVADRATTAAPAPLTRENFADRIAKAQQAAGSVHVESTSGSGARELGVTGDVALGDRLEDTRAQISLDAGPMPMEARLVDEVLYLKIGRLTDGKYARLDLGEDGDLAGLGSLTEGVDPARQLTSLRGALVEFENLGDGGEVDGVPTTRLRLVLDTKKLMGDAAGKAEAPRAQRLPERVEYVLHVGSDDLLRTMTSEVMDTPTTVSWTRWGEPVDVTAPGPDEITDTNLLGGLADLAGGLRRS